MSFWRLLRACGIVALVICSSAPPISAETLPGGVYPFAVGDTIVFDDMVGHALERTAELMKD